MEKHQLIKGFQRLFADSFSDRLYHILEKHKYEHILGWGHDAATREKLFIRDRIKLGETIVPMTLGQGRTSTLDFKSYLFGDLGFQIDATLTTDEQSVVENKHYLQATSTKRDWVIAWIKQERQKFQNATSGAKHTLFTFFSYLQGTSKSSLDIVKWKKVDNKQSKIVIRDFTQFHRKTFISQTSLRKHFVLETIDQNSIELWNPYIHRNSDILCWIYIERLLTIGVKKRLSEALKLHAEVRGPPQSREWIPRKLNIRRVRERQRKVQNLVKQEALKYESQQSDISQSSSFGESEPERQRERRKAQNAIVKNQPDLVTVSRIQKTASQLLKESKKQQQKIALQSTLDRFLQPKRQTFQQASSQQPTLEKHTIKQPQPQVRGGQTDRLSAQRGSQAEVCSISLRHYCINIHKFVQQMGVKLKYVWKHQQKNARQTQKLLEQLYEIGDSVLRSLGPLGLKQEGQQKEEQELVPEPKIVQITSVLASLRKQHKQHTKLELEYVDN